MVVFSSLATLALGFATVAMAIPAPGSISLPVVGKRAASCTFPTPPATTSLSAPITIAAGATYDGGNKRFNRAAGSCQTLPGGSADTVFLLNSGATLQNVVIGANQLEGIYCLGKCNLYNVWFEDVCQNAITIKQIGSSDISNIVGGGAKKASTNVVLHKGAGTVKIDSYCVQDFGTLYKSCENCSPQYSRKSTLSQIDATNGVALVAVNSNYGDVAQIDTASIVRDEVDIICETWMGNSNGGEATRLTSNVSNPYCKF